MRIVWRAYTKVSRHTMPTHEEESMRRGWQLGMWAYHTQCNRTFSDQPLSTIQAILHCIFKQTSHEDHVALSTYAYQSNRTNQSQENSQKPQFWLFLHKWYWLCKTNYAKYDWWHYQIHDTIWDYLNMQHQVNRMNPNRENGQTRVKNPFLALFLHKLCWICIIDHAEHEWCPCQIVNQI